MAQAALRRRVEKPARQKGGKKMWGVRPPKALEDAVEEEIQRRGLERSAYLVERLQLAVDLRAALDDDFYELERLAKVDGISPGALLAKMVRPNLKRR